MSQPKEGPDLREIALLVFLGLTAVVALLTILSSQIEAMVRLLTGR